MSDLIKASPQNRSLDEFCRHVVAEHSDRWPIDEQTLAQAFLRFFDITRVPHAVTLPTLSQRLGIRFSLEELPEDLFGANFAIAGTRLVVVCSRPEHRIVQAHTFLHEVRELLEYEFRSLGYPSCEGSERDLESAADEFAASVIGKTSEDLWMRLADSASNLDSGWKKFGAFCLILLAALAMALNVEYGKQYPRIAKRGPS
jgi:hypothetical protein